MKKIIFIFFLSLPFIAYSQTWDDVNRLGVEAYDNGDYEKAQKYYEEGLLLAKKEYGIKSIYYATALNNYAILYNHFGEFEKSEPMLLLALEIRKKKLGENHERYAYTLKILGYCYQGQGQYEKAEKSFIASAEIHKNLNGEYSEEYASDMTVIGLLYQRMGKYDEAEKYQLLAVEINKKVLGEKDRLYFISLSNLALLYLEVGRLNEAEKLLIQVTEADKKMIGVDHADYGTDLNNLAAVYEDMGDMEKAESFYLNAMKVWEGSVGKKSQQYASVLNNLAHLYQQIGDYERSEQFYTQCKSVGLEVWGEAHPEYAMLLNNLAGLYFDMGKMDEAFLLYKQALIIRKATLGENHPYYANTLNGLGLICLKRDQYVEAEALFLQAGSILIDRLGQSNPMSVSVLMNLAALYIATGNLEKAGQLYSVLTYIIKESVGENNLKYANCQYGLAKIKREEGKWDESDEYFKQCTEGFKNILGEENPFYAKTLNSYGILKEKKGDGLSAGFLFVKSDSILLTYLYKIFRFTSESEKTKYLLTQEEYFNESQTFYLSSFAGRPQSSLNALNLHLATSGLILSSVTGLRESIFAEGGDSATKLYNAWEMYNNSITTELSKPIADRNPILSDWTTKANDLEKQLNKLSQSFTKSSQLTIPTYEEIKKNLKADEAAVEFISFNHMLPRDDSVVYVAILIRPEDSLPVYIPLFAEEQLSGLFMEDSLRTFANLLYTNAQIRSVEHDISYGDSLYQLVWKPLSSYLANKKHINYSPSGLLHKLNFDAIPMNETSVLSDKYSMHRITSSGKLIGRNKETFSLHNVALFGGIDYDMEEGELKQLSNTERNKEKQDHFGDFRAIQDSFSRSGFNYLPGSEKEVHDIYAFLQRSHINSQLYSGKAGNEETVKKLNSINSPSVLHLSTHGFFFPDVKQQNVNHLLDNEPVFKSSDNPLLRSGLVLAGAEYVWKGNEPIPGVEDGILTAYEVSNLYLPNTQLVVMSACETGLGDIKGSEGVYGLQRAFKMAGVDYIIVTLWQVLDKETSEFMILFYQNLLEKKSIPDAFKYTQDAMKEKYRDEPYKWAGFVLIN